MTGVLSWKGAHFVNSDSLPSDFLHSSRETGSPGASASAWGLWRSQGRVLHTAQVVGEASGRRGDALLLSWVTRGARFCVPDSVWGSRGPEPHFENDSCPVKSSRPGSEKTNTTGSPAQSHRASGPATPHSSSSPGGPGWAVRTDDSGSRNSLLYLQVQPRRGNSLASGILLGDTGTDGARSPRLGGEGMLLFFHKAADVSCFLRWLCIRSESKLSFNPEYS